MSLLSFTTVMSKRFLTLFIFFIGIVSAGFPQSVVSRLTRPNRTYVRPVQAKRDSLTRGAVKADSLKASKPKSAFNGKWLRDNHIFDNLDVAFTLGTGGLGLDVGTPVTKWTRLRIGVEGIPKFNIPLNFDVATYSGDGVTNNFEHVRDIMLDITGEEMDENVRMNSKTNIFNFKILLDVFPFQNDRRWYFTAGVYFGSSVIARSVNDKSETNSLVAMNLYNRIYNKMEASEGRDPLFGDIYLSHETYERMMSYGRVGIHIGDFKDGTPYYMTPESNGTVSAIAYANKVKPYLGAGFATPLDKAGKLNIGCEAGMLLWGGTPDVMLPDGVNMTKDLVHVRGKVGRYVNFIKALKVYPVVSFKISYTFF